MSIQIDDEFRRMTSALRTERRWRHLLAIAAGGLVLLTGALALVVLLTDYQGGRPAAGISIPVATLLYAGGSAAFAWGCARGSKHSYGWWLLLTFALGSVMALVMTLTASLGPGAGGGDGSSGSGTNQGASAGTTQRDNLADRFADRELVEQVLGTSLEGPARVARARRSSSMTVWYAGAPSDGVARPLLTAQVRYLGSHKAKAPSVRRARSGHGNDLVSVSGSADRWQVTINVRAPEVRGTVDALLLRRVAESLVALSSVGRPRT